MSSELDLDLHWRYQGSERKWREVSDLGFLNYEVLDQFNDFGYLYSNKITNYNP